MTLDPKHIMYLGGELMNPYTGCKQYTLCILFNREYSRTLLIEKRKGVVYEGHLNGVGGHIEDFDETPKAGATREVGEEAGWCLDRELKWLTTQIFPPATCSGCSKKCEYENKGCLNFRGRGPVVLWVYYGVVSDQKVEQLTNEKLVWCNVEDMIAPANAGVCKIRCYHLNGNENRADVYTHRQLAGDGNLPHFVNIALNELKKGN